MAAPLDYEPDQDKIQDDGVIQENAQEPTLQEEILHILLNSTRLLKSMHGLTTGSFSTQTMSPDEVLFFFSYNPDAFERVCAGEELIKNNITRIVNSITDYRYPIYNKIKDDPYGLQEDKEDEEDKEEKLEYNASTDPDFIRDNLKEIARQIYASRTAAEIKKDIKNKRDKQTVLKEIEQDVLKTSTHRITKFTRAELLMMIYLADKKYNYSAKTSYPLIIERAYRFIEKYQTCGDINFTDRREASDERMTWSFKTLEMIINWDFGVSVASIDERDAIFLEFIKKIDQHNTNQSTYFLSIGKDVIHLYKSVCYKINTMLGSSMVEPPPSPKTSVVRPAFYRP